MSFRMSQERASQIAKALAAKKKIAIEKMEKELSIEITEAYWKSLPKCIQKAFKEMPGYFYTTTSIWINAAGFNRQYQTLTRVLPEHHSERGLKLTLDQAMYFKNKYNILDKAKEEYTQLLIETEAALKSLNTLNKIQEHFPEAAKLIVVNEKKQLAVNIPALREKLKS